MYLVTLYLNQKQLKMTESCFLTNLGESFFKLLQFLWGDWCGGGHVGNLKPTKKKAKLKVKFREAWQTWAAVWKRRNLMIRPPEFVQFSLLPVENVLLLQHFLPHREVLLFLLLRNRQN